jgi:head-tail adaptor
MIIGDLRHVIKVYELTTTKESDFGSEDEVWTEIMELRAAVKYNSGAKTIDNNEIFTSYNVTFITYYRDITPTMRIEWCDDMYTIENIAPINYKDGLQIVCKKINE